MRTPEEIVAAFFKQRTPFSVHDNGFYTDMIRLAVREAVEDCKAICLRQDVRTWMEARAVICDHFKKAGY